MTKFNTKAYFYKEKGKQKRYRYCCACGDGPFKENEITVKFVEFGIKEEIIYCLKCKNRLGFGRKKKSKTTIKKSPTKSARIQELSIEKRGRKLW